MTIPKNVEPVMSAKVQELKKKFVNDVKPAMLENDHIFLQFLIAKDFNLEEAEKSLRKHLAFREDYKVDAISNEITLSDELQKYCGYTPLGFAKDCSPVYFVFFGELDLKGFQRSAKFEDRLRFIIQLTEKEEIILRKQREKTGNYTMGNIMIYDLTNFSFTAASDKSSIEELLIIVKFYKENYPQHIKAAYFVNVNSYYAIFFLLVKRFLSSKTLRKLHMYASPEEWRPVLQKIIDMDTLPAFLGGSRTDPDGNPMCKTFINQGGKIPRELYMKNNNSSSKSKNMQKLVVPRLSFSEVKLKVEESGSVIEWEFETKNREIGFGLFLKVKRLDGEEHMTELLPISQFELDNVLEKGMFRCEKPGTYVMIFDNSYSWFKSKEIYYKVTVMNPSEYGLQMSQIESSSKSMY